ncbi:sigma 54-interacting transcriptional regulator [Candidatus Neomarinimicrobiota bacterium]
MDAFLYRKELKKISGIIISNHFKNKLRYNYAKYKLFKRFSYIKYQDTIVSTPFFFPYFKQNYIFFCKNYPDIVGLVLYSLSDLTEAEIQHYVKSIIKNYSANVSDEYVLKIEKSYKGNRKKIQNIIDSSKIQKKEIMDTITLINIYRDKDFIVKAHYLLERLFQELIFSLQLLNHFDNHEDMDIPTINIIRTYPKLLKDLGKLDKISNSHHPIINMILEDLDKIYKRIQEFHSKPDTLEIASDSKPKQVTSKSEQPVLKKLETVSSSIKFSPNEEQLKIFKEFEKQHGFISRSESMLDVFEFVKNNKNDIRVLITGESGVGKELIVKAIHKESNRKNESLVSENCAGQDSGVLDSLLFGHEKGAFTSADRQHKGIFERANKGTVFLDEIGDMPLKMQNKLLRVIQEKTITRLGGEKEFPVDFRLICATNKNLKNLVKEGTFKEDLLFRIDVAHVEIPSLNERPDDIPYLAEYLFNKFQKKYIPDQYKRAPNWVSNNNFLILKNRHWKGNVRGLEHFMERFVNNNKEYLTNLKSNMFKILFSDSSKTIKDLLNNPTTGNKVFRESKYFEILISYIENHYDRVKTIEVSGYHKDTVRSRLNSSILQLGMAFEFQEESMVDYLVEQKILIENDRDIFAKKIIDIFNSVLTATIGKTKRNFIDPPDKQLADHLFKLRNDLVDQIK